ncbi:hypothetical protein FDECE_15994 [Fusarium decemcellulare]|nr:hypothetical protein FDECE_15994 [Fusarium decemcellulare]
MCAPERGKSAGTGISVMATSRQAHIGLSHGSGSGSDSKQLAPELNARYVGLMYDGPRKRGGPLSARRLNGSLVCRQITVNSRGGLRSQKRKEMDKDMEEQDEDPQVPGCV